MYALSYDIRQWEIKWIKWIHEPCWNFKALYYAQFGTLCHIMSP